MPDILGGGPSRPPWRPPRWLVVACVVVLAAALTVTTVEFFGHRGQPAAGPAAAQSPAAGPTATAHLNCVKTEPAGQPSVSPRAMAALVLSEGPPGLAPGDTGSLEYRDRTAVDGPWSVVIQQRRASSGWHGAVVTFPVGAPVSGRTVDVAGTTGMATDGQLVWPLAGAHARVRGNLPEAGLEAIAAATTVVAGRPTVHAPTGYAAVATEPYRPPTIREVRYGAGGLGGPGAALGGMVFTGVERGGGVEEQLLDGRATGAGPVRGRPAVLTSVFGGNGALAWEPAPGTVAYVGYSGAEMDDATTTALRCLARRSRFLTAPGWRATHPQIIDQVNKLD